MLPAIARRIAPLAINAGLEEITILASIKDDETSQPQPSGDSLLVQPGRRHRRECDGAPDRAVAPARRVRTEGAALTGPRHGLPVRADPDFSPAATAAFVEYDFDESGALVPVDRPYGRNTAGLIVGMVTRPTPRYPEGMTRVALFGDPTKALGTVAEAECARVVAALDLAEKLSAPVEWFALSSGATISMDSGTENMDWVSRALRRIITFTQDGGEINVIVAGINVGAQPYWNAEATMLMHTKGILVMTPDSAMVLTGKQSLDYSGGVSAEDNFGIGGYDRVMGPNGQAQYWAPNLQAACDVLFAHYDHAYVAPGERFPRRAETSDPVDRDVRDFPHVPSVQRIHHRRRHLLRCHQQGPQEAVRHSHGHAFGGRPGPSGTRAVGRHGRRRHLRGVRRAHRRNSGVRHRHRIAGHPAQGVVPRRRAGPVDLGNAVPAVLEEDRARDQRRKRKPTPGGAGKSVGLRRFTGVTPQDSSSSTAPKSAGPSSTSTARSCSAWSRAITAERSWCSPTR